MTDRPRYVIAVDAEITSTRCMFFGHGDEVLAISHRDLRQVYPGPNMVEYGASEIKNLCLTTVREYLFAPSVNPSDCAAMGITNQRRPSWYKMQSPGSLCATSSCDKTARSTGSARSLRTGGFLLMNMDHLPEMTSNKLLRTMTWGATVPLSTC